MCNTFPRGLTVSHLNNYVVHIVFTPPAHALDYQAHTKRLQVGGTVANSLALGFQPIANYILNQFESLEC
jgi:hypothetical protein